MKPLPKALTDEQINFWIANTELTKEEIMKWYASFEEFSTKNASLDKENFIKFFEKLKHSKKPAQELYEILFTGNI